MCACMQNSERASNLLIGALKQFPIVHVQPGIQARSGKCAASHGHLTLSIA